MLNLKRFFFRFTTFLSGIGAIFCLKLGVDIGDSERAIFYPIIAGATGFFGVWLFYGFCYALYDIGKWIYQGLFDKEK